MLHQLTWMHSPQPFATAHMHVRRKCQYCRPIVKYLLTEVGKETCETTKIASSRQHKRKWEIRNMTRTSCSGIRPDGFLLQLNSWAHDECYLQRLFTWNNICHILRTFNLNVCREQAKRFLALCALCLVHIRGDSSQCSYLHFIKYFCTFHCVLSRESETPKAPLIPNEYYSYYTSTQSTSLRRIRFYILLLLFDGIFFAFGLDDVDTSARMCVCTVWCDFRRHQIHQSSL